MVSVKELDISDFQSSRSLLDRWKERYSIKGLKLSGESARVNNDTVEEYKRTILDIAQGCLIDIFNCGETGLLFRVLPLS